MVGSGGSYVFYIRSFQKPRLEKIYPNFLFEERRVLLFFRLPYCPKSEKQLGSFIEQLSVSTDDQYNFRVIWNTRSIKSLFSLKDKVQHVSCGSYISICSCGEN